MTDLEDAWNNYPTSEPPLAQVAVRAQQHRRFRVAASASGTLVAAAVAAALVMSLNTGGTRGTTTTARGTTGHLKLAAFQADLKPAASCDQLLNTYRERGLKEVSAYGWNRGVMPLYGELRSPYMAVPQSSAGLASGSTALDQANSSTGTNVQEVGVDEPDTVKTNGSVLVRIDGNTLTIYDVTGDAPRKVSTLGLPYLSSGQILLAGSNVVAIGYDAAPASSRPNLNSRVEVVSLRDAAHPAITSNIAYSGAVTAARQSGTSIRLVTTTGLPPLNFVMPSDDSKAALDKALKANQTLVSHSTLAQWLPTIDTGNGQKQLMPCSDVAVTPDTVPLGTTSVIGFDASNPTAVSAIGLSGLTSIAYESADHLYLSTGGTQMGPCACFMIPAGGTTDRTTIFAFDLVGDQAAHVATGTVEGTIKDRWSMDEVGGVLRVATTQMVNGKQTSSVVTLKQSGEALTQVGRVDGLGIGETLTAARWFDTFAVVSTAQQVDPLFTVDLTDPAHPKLLGALHIPGYSSYFHPLGNGLLLGVGQNVAFNSSGEQSQAQIGLFDISDLTNVRRVAESSLDQWTRPVAGEDPHAFTWLPDHHTALTFFTTQGGTMVLGEFTVSGQSLSQKLIPVQATDPSTVRTLELPNGRVVLMAGGSVTFLPL